MDESTNPVDGLPTPPSQPSPDSNGSGFTEVCEITHLPRPRCKPLAPGSAKEEKVRRYIECRLMLISRKYVKKFQPYEEGDCHGYTSFENIAIDLADVVDILWLSSTPSLQIPYMLNVALAVTTYIMAFPPAPVETFALLKRLDHVFTSLMIGEDFMTGEKLPGFNGNPIEGLSKTDMVRLRSIVEATRVMVVAVISGEHEKGNYLNPTETGDEMDTASVDTPSSSSSSGEEDEDLMMDVARVYEDTITQLDQVLRGRSGLEPDVVQN